MAQQNTDSSTYTESSVFMSMGDMYMSSRTSNPTCNIHLRPGVVQTLVGRGVDGDRMALRLPITMGGGFAGLYYETRHNVLVVKSFETEAEVDEWLNLQVFSPTIDRDSIPFEAQIDLTGVLALTAPGDRDRMRSWFFMQMRAFVDKHNLSTNDGWINFRALPPVN